MKKYHVTGNQRIKGNFELYVEFDDSRGWILWRKFNDLEDCYSEQFVIPNLHNYKIIEIVSGGSKEDVFFYMD